MIQPQASPLEDSRKRQIQIWLSQPEAEWFKDVIRANMVLKELEVAKEFITRANRETAGDAAADIATDYTLLSFVLDAMHPDVDDPKHALKFVSVKLNPI